MSLVGCREVCSGRETGVVLHNLTALSNAEASRVQAAWVDRQARKGTGPSDHAPVIVDLDEAPDGDIGPVVPPPSSAGSRKVAFKLPQSRGE